MDGFYETVRGRSPQEDRRLSTRELCSAARYSRAGGNGDVHDHFEVFASYEPWAQDGLPGVYGTGNHKLDGLINKLREDDLWNVLWDFIDSKYLVLHIFNAVPTRKVQSIASCGSVGAMNRWDSMPTPKVEYIGYGVISGP